MIAAAYILANANPLWRFAIERAPELWSRTGEHLLLTGLAMAIAVVLGVPLGIVCRRFRAVRGWVLGAVGIMQTIPSLAMLAILLSALGKIGAIPAVIALALYALLPIVRNTLTGLAGVPAQTIEAARGVGMTKGQQLRMVRIPLALPVIAAGIRTAAVTCVGIATLSAFIGAGGLGQFINRGLALDDYRLILLGAVAAGVLALLVDFSIFTAQWALSAGKRRSAAARILRAPALAMPLGLVALGIAASVINLTPSAPARTALAGDRIGTPGTIRVGSKEFGEQLLLGEMMAQLIEARTYLTIERRLGLGGTDICNSALRRGEIDIYAEYTGTAYRSILKIDEEPAGPYDVYCRIREGYRRLGLTWLEPLGFENTYAITVRRADAEKHGWKTVSDLAAHAGDLRAGFTSEFQERADGYPGLKEAYGFSFAKAVDISADLMCQALSKGEVDVICAFSTDGRIAAYELQPLKDDKRYWPPYDAAPVVRSAFLAEHPEIKAVLGELAGLLDNDTMRRLNYAMQGDKRPPTDVAREFLRARGLVK